LGKLENYKTERHQITVDRLRRSDIAFAVADHAFFFENWDRATIASDIELFISQHSSAEKSLSQRQANNHW